ncbi:hypothetical protein JCM10449v2_006882 [Rhodotorula kratochvilovae]
MPPRRAPPAAATRQAQPAWRSPVPQDHNRYLPQHDAEAFTKCLGMYENKHFKDGLETVQQVLDKHPNHGESLVMKGIFLCSLDRKPEGYDCVRRGVKNDPGSHIVWHVYALVLRADKNFGEALKCYKKAVEIEKDSLNLLNDMAPIAVHLRKYDDYVSIRLSMLKSQPRVRRNWVNLAVAQFLARQYRAATQTLAYYEDMLRDVPEGDVEMGEVLLFHAQVLEEAGEYERCLDFLGEKSAQIVDRTAYTVQRARLLLKLGRTESALWAWEVLLGENPESTEYIKATVQAKGGDCDSTDPATRLATFEILDAYSAAHPRSLSIQRMQLSVLPASAPQFRQRAARYILNALAKGVPSVFADIKALYKGEEGEEKARIVGEVVEEFRKGLEEKGAVVTEDTGDDETVESPSTYLWTLYFLASHHSSLGAHSTALSILALALAHTPSLPELHTLRARILKRAGDAVGAARAMEHARSLDGQDRFLNSKAAKYAIRNGEMDRAEKTVGLFTRKDAPSPFEDLVEMQCLWFLQEEGDAYAAREDWGRALRRYHQILDTFHDIQEDQYDFHTYCMRKYTLKAYVELLRFEDKVRDHPRFLAAARGAVSIYCRMHDDPAAFAPAPPAVNGASEKAEETKVDGAAAAQEEGEEKALSRKDKKKAKGKAKKADKPDEKKKDEDDAASNVYRDTDPLGAAQLATARKDPLEQALRFLRPLQVVRPDAEETLRLTAEVQLRRGKPLAALQALQTAQALYPSSAAFLPLVARLTQASAQAEAVSSVLASGVAGLLGGAQPAAYVDAQLQAHDESSEWLVAAAEAKQALGDKEGATALLQQLVEREDLQPNLTLVTRAHSLLASLAPSAAASFRTAAAARFPLARTFKSAEELAALDAKAEMEGADPAVEGEVKEEA